MPTGSRSAEQNGSTFRTKRVVWALHQWKNPDLGPGSLIQLLDQPGAAENGDLLR